MGGAGSTSSSNPAVNFPINYLQRAGVFVQKIVTTTGELLLLKVGWVCDAHGKLKMPMVN